MSLSTVTVTWDEVDIGQTALAGTITFALSAPLGDATDGLTVNAQPPRSYRFSSGTGTSDPLVANDNANLPAGSYYKITVSILGQQPYTFAAQVNHANGATQTVGYLLQNQLQPTGQFAAYLQLAGGTMTGPLTLAGDPTAALMAATKEYVDAAVASGWVFPSGDTSGATDQAAITALETAAAAGTVRSIAFWPGTFWVQGLTKQSGSIWRGAGRGVSVIKLAAGSNRDVVQGAGFTSLTLTGQTTIPNAGIGSWGLRDLTIDGNRGSQTGTSYGLRFYGYDFRLEHVTIQNCLTDGIYSEWGNFGGTGLADFDDTAGVLYDVAIWGNGGNGWHNRGPHDSVATKVYIYDNGSGSTWGYWGETNNPTTVAAGSSGTDVSTFTGGSPGTLNVATTLGWNTASVSVTQGALTVVTALGTATITYTGVTATSFTGCVAHGAATGSTVTTGAAIGPVGAYSAAGQLMNQCHTWFNQAWGYVLDTQTHLIDCIAEVAGTGMILVRGNDCQIEGGFLIIYSQFSPTGCGLQIGDTVNAVAGLRADTKIAGLSGADTAHAAVSIVNDGGTCSIDALVYQPSGTAVFGTPNATSRYRVTAGGATAAANAANSLYQDSGQVRIYVPPSSANAWRLTPGGGSTDALNYESSVNRLDLNNGILLQGWSGAYSGSTWQLDASKGHMAWPSATAPGGAITAAIGTAGNGAAVTVTGNDRRGKITVTTASTGVGSFPATVANFTFAQAYSATPRVLLTPWDGPSAAVLAYGQAFSATQFLLGFNGAPASSTTYTYTYCIEG